MRRLFLIPAALALTLGVVAGNASARPSIRDAWLAAYPNACQMLKDAANACSLCHGTGFSLNPYASDILANGIDPVAVESMDSDGDNRTNLQEIGDCTLPGDATSFVPIERVTWGFLKGRFD